MFLKQATAAQSRLIGPFVSDSDFKTVQTGLTIANTDIKISANGAAGASKNSGGGTHRNNGMYGITLDATDTATVGELAGSVVVTGALPVAFKFFVVEEVVYDAWYAASAVGYITDQPVNATKVGGTSQTGRDIGASVLLSAGSGTGQLDFTSGVVKANLAQILGTALTETSGQIAAAFKKFFNIATPASTMDALTLVTTATNLTNAPTSGDFTATMKTSIGTAVAASAVASVTGNVGGNVTGSVGSVVGAVGSVTGAVGSVTGNVGGNIVGTVASVVGAVGSVTGAVGSVTGNVGGNLAGTLSTTERSAIADTFLDRDMSTGTDSGSTTVRTVRQALRFLRNKWTISGGTLSVKKENDSTDSWTATVTQTAGDPVSTVDPA